MGSSSSRPKPKPLKKILVPPQFQRRLPQSSSRLTQSSFAYIFKNSTDSNARMPLQALLENYVSPSSKAELNLITTKDGPNSNGITANIAFPSSNPSNVKGSLTLFAENALDPGCFGYIDGCAQLGGNGSSRVRSCLMMRESGLGSFLNCRFQPQQSGSTNPTVDIGARFASENLSVGVMGSSAIRSKNAPSATTWLVGQNGSCTFGAEAKVSFDKDATSAASVSLASYGAALRISNPRSDGDALKNYFELKVVDGGARFCAGYFQQFQLVRPVYNPLEKNDVVGIYSYVNVGLQLDRKFTYGPNCGTSKTEDTVSAAASVQLNKHWLAKLHADTRYGPRVALAMKPSTSNPQVCCAASVGLDGTYGFSFQLENSGAEVYDVSDPMAQAQQQNKVADGRRFAAAQSTPSAPNISLPTPQNTSPPIGPGSATQSKWL